MTYTATAAYPYINAHHEAVAALRVHLRMIAARDRAAPDWSTLNITGPTEVVGGRGTVWYEWAATVDAQNEPARSV